MADILFLPTPQMPAKSATAKAAAAAKATTNSVASTASTPQSKPQATPDGNPKATAEDPAGGKSKVKVEATPDGPSQTKPKRHRMYVFDIKTQTFVDHKAPDDPILRHCPGFKKDGVQHPCSFPEYERAGLSLDMKYMCFCCCMVRVLPPSVLALNIFILISDVVHAE